jgi:uncharacterized protein (UPF0335 family)
MGRPKGSKNRPHDGDGFGHNGGPELRDSISGSDLRGYIERIEYINGQQKELSCDRSQIFKELKTGGYDRDTVRAIVRRRKLTEEQRETADALMDQYMSALGDFAGTPLGEAGANRVRAAAE